MKKILALSFLLLLVSCDKPKNEEFAHNVKCANNEIVYKTKYSYPIEIESEEWDDAFGCSLVKNTYSDGYGKLVFDDDITMIPEYAFQDVTALTHIKLPNSVKFIKNRAFAGCDDLKSIVIPNGVMAIGGNVFLDCISLTSITLPKSLTSINGSIFSGCISLRKIVISDLSAWCKMDFYQGNPLSSDIVRLYVNNKELTRLTIPSDVNDVSSYAFSGYSALTSVTIKSNVTSIGNYAFSDCPNLRGVYCKATTPPTIGINAFGRNVDFRRIFVPRESLQLYQSQWSYYAEDIIAYDFE